MYRARLLVVGLALSFCSPLHALVISEVMYHPQTDEPHNEYVELYNETAARVDLSRWFFSAGIDYTFPVGTVLDARGYLVVARDPATIQARYGISNVVGPFAGALNNSSDHIILRDPAGGVMAEVDYDDGGKWPVAADGAGHSLSKLNLRGDPNDADNWRASPLPGGTPGRDNGFQAVVEDNVLIAPGDVWRYFKGRTEASNPATAWRQLTFDDTGWSSGPTGIGYGDGDDATLIDDMRQGVPPGNPGYWCIFCRKAFDLTDPAAVSQLILEVDHDDGFIAYLNGAYVGSANMTTTAAVTYTTPATGHEASGGDTNPQPPTVLDLTPFKGLLRAGTNVLAIQIHNNVLNSSDLSLIPTLRDRKVHAAGDPPSPVVINEVCFHTSGTQFIELYNKSDGPVNIGRHYLSNDPDNPQLCQISTGTLLAGHGHARFLQSELGFTLNTAGDRVLFTSPTANVVLAAREVAPGPKDWSTGRWPDGHDDWYNMAPTTGTANLVALTTAVVVNEIMYHPPSNNSADEYVELYNVSDSPVSLAGWSFSDGIRFDFPTTAGIGPRQYLVVAKDRARLISRYGLSPAIVLGNTSGTLSDGGDRVRLRDANHNIVDEVKFSDGGRWSEFADGCGSSLELIDPRQDNGNCQAWAPSDERGKAVWTRFSYSGVVATDPNPRLHELHLMLLGRGVVLVDDLRLTLGATDYVANGGFESGIGNWLCLGTHVASRVTTETAHSGTNCLKIVTTGSGDPGANHIEQDSVIPMPSGQTYTLTFWAKWQYGNNQLVTRCWNNQLAETNALPVPALTGTPGTTNSVYRANLGPVFSKVRHSPVVPAPGNSVTIRAEVYDPDGITSAVLYFKADADPAYIPVVMRDDGTGGDNAAGDGNYVATVPPRAAGQTVAFYFVGIDRRGAVNTWPADVSRPAHYRVEAAAWTSNFPRYRVVLTAAEQALLFNRPHLSNDPVNCTFIFDENEVYYNCGVVFTGSPYGRGGGGYRGYDVSFPADDLLFGWREVRFDKSQNAGYRDHLGYDMLRYMGQPTCPGEFVDVRVNARNEGVNEDLIPPGKLYLDKYYRGNSDGPLFELSSRYEFTSDNDLVYTNFVRGEPTWQNWGNDKDPYRWNWRVRNHDREDDFTSMILAIQAVSRIPNASAEPEVLRWIDVQQWARVMAVRAVDGDWDFFATRETKNCYFYFHPGTRKWQLIPWDNELGFYDNSCPLWAANVAQINSYQHFRANEHYFLNAVHEYLAKYFTRAFMDPWIDHYFALVGGQSAATTKAFIDARRANIQSQIDPYLLPNTIINITNPDPLAIPTTSATLSGTAPANVSWVRYQGQLYWPAWTDAVHWTVTLPVPHGSNLITLEFLDYDQVLVGTDSITVMITLPIPATFLINGGATYATASTATLTLNVSGPYPVAQMHFSNNAVAWGPWVDYVTTSTWPLPAPDGPKSVYAQLRTSSGDFSPVYGDTIILDTGRPWGTVLINNGAAVTNRLWVTLFVSGSDATSYLTHMRFSNNGANWTAWESYANYKAWPLPLGNGVKTVYLQVRDAAGNVSLPATDTIELRSDTGAAKWTKYE